MELQGQKHTLSWPDVVDCDTVVVVVWSVEVVMLTDAVDSVVGTALVVVAIDVGVDVCVGVCVVVVVAVVVEVVALVGVVVDVDVGNEVVVVAVDVVVAVVVVAAVVVLLDVLDVVSKTMFLLRNTLFDAQMLNQYLS